MPWLVVLGTRTWGYGRERFKPGKHEVSDEIAEAARKLGSPTILVLPDEPQLAENRPDGKPLDLEDIRTGVVAGVHLRKADVIPEAEAAERDPRSDYDCPYCPAAFPSAPARDRHIEFNHAVSPQ